MEQYKQRFLSYVAVFYTGDEEVDRNIRLKEIHSLHVYENMRDLAEALGLSPEQAKSAEIAGLFHDVGRFEQLRTYNTFNDKQSIDHGKFGVDVLKQENLLRELSTEEKDRIYVAVLNHNKHKLPALQEKYTLLAEMIRDADKLDIYRVVTEHYREENGNGTVTLHLPDKPEISDAVFQSVINGETVAYDEMRTIADFKVMKIGWIFDLNFDYTIERIIEEGYLDQLLGSLPLGEKAERVKRKVMGYVTAAIPKEKA